MGGHALTLAGMLNGARPISPRMSLAALLSLAALGLGACQATDSNDGEIPPAAAAGLQGALSDLEGAAAAGSCRDARAAVELFGERAEAVGEVPEDVAEQLAAGARRLDTLVRRDVCEPSGTTGPATALPPPATTTTEEEPQPEEDEEDDESGGSRPPREPKPPKPPKDEGGPGVPPGPPETPGRPPAGETEDGTDGTGGTGTEEGG